MRLRSSDIIIVILIASGMAFLSADHTSGDEKERWKEIALLETAGWLPTSVAFSPEGKLMVLGGAAGEVAAFDSHTRERKWKTSVGGALAAVAFSADGASVLATFQDGVPLLDSATGQAGAVLEAKKSRPTAVAAFPDRKIGNEKKLTTHKIVFGNARGYFVKTWIVPESAGGIELNTAGENQPADPQAVPLAVDPRGRSVILTGPGNRETGKNVLWAWVAGEYEEGSPGNRILKGHDTTVVSAAWSKNGKTVATGDAAGTVIVWNAETMEETRRRELPGRIAAVAVSPDGKHVAAIAVENDAKYFLWDADEANPGAEPLATDSADYAGPIRGLLAFSHDGKQLVGSAANLAWLTRLGELVGKVHIWSPGHRAN